MVGKNENCGKTLKPPQDRWCELELKFRARERQPGGHPKAGFGCLNLGICSDLAWRRRNLWQKPSAVAVLLAAGFGLPIIHRTPDHFTTSSKSDKWIRRMADTTGLLKVDVLGRQAPRCRAVHQPHPKRPGRGRKQRQARNSDGPLSTAIPVSVQPAWVEPDNA